MIERGREVIMEEVVFDQQSEAAVETRVPLPSQRVAAGAPRLAQSDPQVKLSFVVNPMIREDGLSFVTWWSTSSDAGTQRHQCWSNLDWAALGTGISFVSGGVHYDVMCLTGKFSPDASGEGARRSMPRRWLRPFPEMRPSYHLERSPTVRRYRPEPQANSFINALHRYFESNHRDLWDEIDLRRLAGQEREQARLRERDTPRNLTIRFGLRPRANAPENVELTTPTR